MTITLPIHDKRYNHRGFALIATLSLIVLLAFVAIALLTTSSTTSSTTAIQSSSKTAQANAKMALAQALNALQEEAGSDLRATATADILSMEATTEPQAGRANWVGVWDTENYNPTTYGQKNTRFRKWLVSHQEASFGAASSVNSDILTDSFMIFDGGINSGEGTVDQEDVVVDKIEIKEGNSVVGKYAYWVEDEGMKADLSWHEPAFADNDRALSARLSVGFGANPESFVGDDSPFGSEVSDKLLINLEKVNSPYDLALANDVTGSTRQWLKDHRHNLTVGSYGVLSDMKLGGLKRDLSMAFEMDGQNGNRDVSSSSLLFNQQVGEFVGGTDRLASPHIMNALTVKERFLYRDTQGANSWFSGDIHQGYTSPDWTSVRGPNWWALRDYANLYKSLSKRGDEYSLAARPYFPNISNLTSSSLRLTEIGRSERSTHSGSGYLVWNSELNKTNQYQYRPAGMTYGPFHLGTYFYYSVRVRSGQLEFVCDPVFYIWNPYNVKIDSLNYLISCELGIPGQIKFTVTDSTGANTQTYGPQAIAAYFRGSSSLSLRFLAPNISLDPGEVIALSPPSTTDAALNSLLAPGYNVNPSSGLVMSSFPVNTQVPRTDRNGDIVYTTNKDADGNLIPQMVDTSVWQPVPISTGDTITAEFGFGFSGLRGSNSHDRAYRLATYSSNASDVTGVTNVNSWGDELQMVSFWKRGTGSDDYQESSIELIADGEAAGNTSSHLSAKHWFGALAYVASTADDERGDLEVMSHFNPTPIGNTEGAFYTNADPNFQFKMFSLTGEGAVETYNDRLNIGFSESATNALWGSSTSTGNEYVPFRSIPSQPLLSIAQLSEATLTTRTFDPAAAVGNSFANLFVEKSELYSRVDMTGSPNGLTSSDHSWLLNDSLFDRYYFSGLAPDYTIQGSGYSTTETLLNPLQDFYGSNYELAEASPVMLPYIPVGKTQLAITTELNDTVNGEGYKKLGAYALTKGQFNVNSTSVLAWESLLKSNRDLGVKYAEGGMDSASGTPFPTSTFPSSNGDTFWAGVERLTDAEITSLATQIVSEVKSRGPFLSLSDFINRRLSNDAFGSAGAVQAAIDASGINSDVQTGGGGVSADYGTGALSDYFASTVTSNGRSTTTGIAQDITQAKLLTPLAPRLNARSDTFRIRAYGETVSSNGDIKARAMCEAWVQRVPEYFDSESNEPWEENYTNPITLQNNATSGTLSALNDKFGRRFKIVGFKWLDENEY